MLTYTAIGNYTSFKTGGERSIAMKKVIINKELPYTAEEIINMIKNLDLPQDVEIEMYPNGNILAEFAVKAWPEVQKPNLGEFEEDYKIEIWD